MLKFTVKGNAMKNELKQLYYKDKDLAIKVARVLGYKIKSDINDKELKNNVLTPLNEAAQLILKAMNNLEKQISVSKPINKLSLVTLDTLRKLRESIKKL